MGKITREELAHSLNDHIESQSKNKQNKIDDNLKTSDKTIVGAINELYKDINDGKQIIADAINNDSITKDSTFEAMGEVIRGLNTKVNNLTNELAGKVTPAGTAIANDVLSGKTFINNTGHIITGTIPYLNSNLGNASANSPSHYMTSEIQVGDYSGTGGQCLYFRIPQGYYTNIPWIMSSVPDLLPANIVSGKSICGVTGTYSGATLIAGTKYTLATYSDRIFLSYILYGDWNFYSYTMPYTGTVSVYMHAKQDTGSNSATYTVKRHNSANTVISTHPFSVNGENSTTINIAVNKGDIIRCYGYGNGSYFYTDCKITFDLSE